MKVSVNWIKEYLDFELPPVDELVTKIGAQIGAVEEVIDIGTKYKSIVVAKVVSCEKHPNADKLNVCTIDDGGNTPDVKRNENGHVQVVCGAPNVREGLLVAWIPPKAVVPSTYDTSDPFALEARELRGVVSNGMLASGKELAINEDHDGILEIDEDAKPGQAFAEVYGLNDYIIDIENKMFTHRPDCFGQLGVAREIAGILGHKFTSPDWYLYVRQDIFSENTELEWQNKLQVLVSNDLPELVPRFVAISIGNVNVRQSPIKIQSLLSRVGVRPINNVVDVTNYVMLLTGQPLHAYDYDKLQGLDYERNPIQERLEPEVEARKKSHVTLRVRYPEEGEKIKLLNGKEIEPRPEAIMIASEKHLIGIGGVMGGIDTEVDENTKNIILECANFDMYSIRRTSMAHGLFTDAVTRFNKGQSPLQNDKISAHAASMLQDLAGGRVVTLSDIQDKKTITEANREASLVTYPSFINQRLGLNLGLVEITTLLENVEFHIEADSENNNAIFLDPPFWRTDIEIPEDIVEEVGRLYGYDKLPLELPKRTITPTQRNTLLETKAKIRDVLSQAGANEVLTYSFVHGDLLEKVGQNKDLAFKLSNALSPELQYYRLGLTPSLLEKVHPNIKTGHGEFALFEIGKAHIIGEQDRSEADMPMEFNSLSFVYAANQGTGAAYYEAQKYLRHLLQKFKVKGVEFEPLVSADLQGSQWLIQLVAPYEPERSVVIKDDKGTIWGVLGEFKASVRKSLKLPESTAGFEVGPLLLVLSEKHSTYTPLPKFPKVMQDITLKVPAHVTHAALASFVTDYLQKHKEEHTILTVTDKDIYQKEDDKDHKQVTFGISIASYEKTMRDEEVTKLLDELASTVKKNLDAERV